MTKHATQTATLSELRTLIAGHTDTPWQDVLEIDCDDVDAYAREHADDVYEIWWPEHVSYPRYNSDATYRLIGADRAFVDQQSLEEAVIEYIESVDRLQCHVHLRLRGDGTAYVDTDAGYCVSDAEYNRVPGHVRTVKHQQGHGQSNLVDGWMHEDDGMNSIANMVTGIIEELERSGLEVEVA